MNNKLLGKVAPADFGFSEVTFVDELGEICAIQTVTNTSQLVEKRTQKSLIIGVKQPHCYIAEQYAKEMEIEGKPDESGLIEFDLPESVIFNSSIRLSEDQVIRLIARLSQWVDNGTFSDKNHNS